MVRAFPRRFALRLVAHASLAAFLISTSVEGQIDRLKLFQQNQRASEPDGAGSTMSTAVPDCADPNNTESGECAGSPPFDTPSPVLKSRRPRTPLLSNTGVNSAPLATVQPGAVVSPAIPPEPPTEFQRFVRGSTGQLLPVYGSWLFEHAPSTFAPVDHTPVPPDYTLGPSDEVDVQVWGQINFNQHLLIDRSGDIFIPQVGRISLTGLRYTELRDTLKNAIGRVFKNFDLNVNMGQLRSIQVLVVGEVRHPGTYTVSSFSTLVNALFASGGPSSRGSMRSIQLKRQGQVITSLDLYDLLLNGDKSCDVRLQPGDVIFIPHAGPRVAVSGSVETPGIYELKQTASLQDVLHYAGGLSPLAAGKEAILERVDDHARLESKNLSLDADGLAARVQDGDIVRLLSVVPRYDKIVTLRGNVADSMRFAWRAGMKISDVIPDKQFLLTRGYWAQHNQTTSGSPLSHDELESASADKSVVAVDSDERPNTIRHFGKKNDLQPPVADIDWDYAAVERLDPQDLTTHLIPFNLSKAILEHSPEADLTLEPSDVISIFSNSDFVTPRARQTMYIRLEGEISMAGVYSVRPGDTLRTLLARAGGLTEGAYIYGAQFTRESARKEQSQRLAQYINQLEDDINQNASTLATRAISTEQDATLHTALETQRATISRLRKTPITGRIVLGVAHDAQGIDSLPDIALENGDRLIVPAAPAIVEVVGAVYNQSTFLYKPGIRVSDYLGQAGGPTRYADRSRMFVIRADGSVVSKDTASRPKVSGELLGHVYSHLYGIRFIALRFFTVYGPRHRPDLAISKLSRLMLAGSPVPLFGNGAASRDYTYVEDIVKGVQSAMNYRGSLYEVINLGNNCPIRLSEIVHMIESALGVSAEIERFPEQLGEVPHTCANIDKANRLLGYQPSTALPAGVLKFTESLRALGTHLTEAARSSPHFPGQSHTPAAANNTSIVGPK